MKRKLFYVRSYFDGDRHPYLRCKITANSPKHALYKALEKYFPDDLNGESFEEFKECGARVIETSGRGYLVRQYGDGVTLVTSTLYQMIDLIDSYR